MKWILSHNSGHKKSTKSKETDSPLLTSTGELIIGLFSRPDGHGANYFHNLPPKEPTKAAYYEAQHSSYRTLVEDWASNDSNRYNQLLDLQTSLSGSAKRILTLANFRLVQLVSKRFQIPGQDYNNINQNAFLGLLQAVQKFDVIRGFKFSTYAPWWIRQSIIREHHSTSRMIRAPEHVVKLDRPALETYILLTQTSQREPTTRELASSIGISEEILNAYWQSSQPSSLDQFISPDGDTDTLATLIKYPGDDLDALREESLIQETAIALSYLTDQQRQAVELAMGFIDKKPQTSRQIGTQLGVSHTKAQNILNSAIDYLRKNPKINARLARFLS